VLIVEEKLLASREDEIRSAVYALQHFVLEFHGIPFQPQLHKVATVLLNWRTAHAQLRLAAPKGRFPTVSPGPWPDATM